MASSTKLSATLLIIFSVLLYSSTFSSACASCKPATPPKKRPPPPPACPPPPAARKTPPATKTPPAPSKETCPRDTLKLGVCADLLGLVNLQIGSPASSPCCALLKDLVDLEAALCLCTALKANVLGINLDVPISLSLLLSACQKTVPSGFKCE